MGVLRTKLDELSTEIESFINDVTGEIKKTQAEIDGVASGVLSELKTIRPKVLSIQTKANTEFDALIKKIDKFKE